MNAEMLKRWGLISVILLFTMAIIVGCGKPESDGNGEEEVNDSNGNEQVDEDSGQTFPITITDDAEREVTIENKPKSIISLQASTTEIVFDLGLGDKVIGVSDYSNYPEETQEIDKLGGQEISVEKVLSLLPQIAFVTDYHYENAKETIKQFEEAGITVVVVGSATSFDDVYSDITMIAKATGTTTEAEETISHMKMRLAEIKEKADKEVTDKKEVWVEVSPAPDIYTTGTNTFMNEMLESIQAINVAAEYEGWVSLSEEEIVKLNPEAIVTTYGYYVDNPRQDVLSREGWAEVPAVKNEHVVDVNNDTVTRPGPRLIEGVETLAELVYPEVFKK
ncbi:ABC transporter substrate-binding protein [Lentibacillus cibarius]|nr:ABC transporter substrate-binding protein [Lentibacillus cibarius]